MTTHRNELFSLDELQIAEAIGLVQQSPEMEVVYQLETLRDRYQAEDSNYQTLRQYRDNAMGKVMEVEERERATRKVHDVLCDKIRKSEELAYQDIMNHKDIAKFREIWGKGTEREAKRAAISVLCKREDYQQALVDLEQLQKELEAFGPELAKLRSVVESREEEAKAQARKAGEVLLEVRALEAKFNG